MPKDDEFTSHIINDLISKLKTISENEVTVSLVNKLIDDSVNDANKLSYINNFLKEYSEGSLLS